jgi:hypothetical protein
MSKKIVWTMGVTTRGVKKRCRKPDTHIESQLIEADEPSEEKAKEVATQWLRANMKQVISAQATATLWTHDGPFKSWNIFEPTHNLKWPLEL